MFPPTGFGGFSRGFLPEEIRKFSYKEIIVLTKYIKKCNRSKDDEKRKNFHKGKAVPITDDGSSLRNIMLEFQKEARAKLEAEKNKK